MTHQVSFRRDCHHQKNGDGDADVSQGPEDLAEGDGEPLGLAAGDRDADGGEDEEGDEERVRDRQRNKELRSNANTLWHTSNTSIVF